MIKALARLISSRYKLKTSSADSQESSCHSAFFPGGKAPNDSPDHAAEPVVFVGQGQVLHHAEAVPSRWQHRPPQLLLRQALQDPEDMWRCWFRKSSSSSVSVV